MNRLIFCLVLMFYSFQVISAQDPQRFQKEIDEIRQLSVAEDPGNNIILFTGSSSMKMWNNIEDYFPGKMVINTGFGGSQMSDLLFWLDETVIRFHPDQVFIYEGDNDIAEGKNPSRILKDAKKVIRRLNQALPSLRIVFISPKPSLARWTLKENYEKLNTRFNKYAERSEQVDFVNIWPVMLDATGEPAAELFIEDGLHINQKGYSLWADEIRKFMK